MAYGDTIVIDMMKVEYVNLSLYSIFMIFCIRHTHVVGMLSSLGRSIETTVTS